MKFALALMLILISALINTSNGSDLEIIRSIGASWREQAGIIVELKTDCTNFEDEHYQKLGQLTSLKSLSISGKNLSDHQLEMLSGLTELESILINGSELTDEGYRHFKAFQKLKTLSLFHPSRNCEDFTGSGLAYLKDLPRLERLTFAGATAGDEAFAAVGKIAQLKEFRQWHNWETPNAIKHLVGLKQLESLQMGQRLPRWGTSSAPSFDDETLEVIAQIKSLKRLTFQEARLSAAGLLQLQSLPELEQVKLSLIDISKSDVETIKAEMPNVKVDWTPLTETEDEATLKKKLKI
ncbi:hypothetical protein [Rubinisphaera sp.]|uniref:hypothetical protein n=1 Tax=Rubinisphaera sp. TaxID=2024857 RepID=UPI000C0F1800|nr:hypothetical protein [Rubinisphaera sp.]MBV12272.1 hypothetical protein [Rubinisphaera sp.]HCS55285.1 hypothetical protein [Planctomycetaceae bacterium]|tara:strand:- start:7088 stop:7975 length:888 start_codon:yes stop_codon:yes gene_type:complete